MTFICELLYVTTTAMAKISIGVYFLRLAGKRYQVLVIYTVMGVVALFSTMYFFFLVFQCTPVDYLWLQFTNMSGTCVGPTVLANATYAHAAISAITDWAFGILPVFFVWNLQMNPRTKLSVALILGLGFLYVLTPPLPAASISNNKNSASTATIVRIVYIRDLTETSDYSWEGINLVKWSLVEPAIGITAAAIATLRPLFKNLLSRRKRHRSTELGSSAGRGQFVRSSNGQDIYSVGFADMLGLRRVGVTTVISAVSEAERKAERLEMKRKAKLRKLTGEDLYYNTSQTELNDGASEETANELDWTRGITKTTIVTIEK